MSEEVRVGICPQMKLTLVACLPATPSSTAAALSAVYHLGCQMTSRLRASGDQPAPPRPDHAPLLPGLVPHSSLTPSPS